jgi:hypothetical protein
MSRTSDLSTTAQVSEELGFAVDRLYGAGWSPAGDADLERLPDGRAYPSVLTVQREFARAGLDLAIKHNLVFNCYRASWTCARGTAPGAAREGTVVGKCENEAAVYALAQLLEAGSLATA